MINPDFYTAQNARKIYLGGKIEHFMRRDPAVVLKSYPYFVKEGEDLYTIGSAVFGDDKMFLWTIIGDTNVIKQPDEWLPGNKIDLPAIILNVEAQKSVPKYESATSFTTVL